MEQSTINDQVLVTGKHLNFKSKPEKNFQDVLDTELKKSENVKSTRFKRNNFPVFQRPNIAIQIELQSFDMTPG